jgi:hypothetical protein
MCGAQTLRDDQIEVAAYRFGGTVSEQNFGRRVPALDRFGPIRVNDRVRGLIDNPVAQCPRVLHLAAPDCDSSWQDYGTNRQVDAGVRDPFSVPR